MPAWVRLAGGGRPVMKTARTGLGEARGRGGDLAGGVLGAGKERRDEHRDDRVDLLGRAEQAQKPAVLFGAGAGDHIDRIAGGGLGWQAGCSAAWMSSDSSGTSSPAASQASATRMPGPPPFVSTATRRPAGTG